MFISNSLPTKNKGERMKTTKIAGLTIRETESLEEFNEISKQIRTIGANEIYFFKEPYSGITTGVYMIYFLFRNFRVSLSRISLLNREETLERSLAEMHNCKKGDYLVNPDFLNQHLDGKSYSYGWGAWKIDRIKCEYCGEKRDKKIIKKIEGKNVCTKCIRANFMWLD